MAETIFDAVAGSTGIKYYEQTITIANAIPKAAGAGFEITGLPTEAVPICVTSTSISLANSSVELKYYNSQWYVRILAVGADISANTTATVRIFYV